jgi:endonuclease/exonuclease/phosphatase family metal-dependent hydrolase
VNQNTYPSWGAKLQFDYILSDQLLPDEYQPLPISTFGISDHLPIGIETLK